MDFTGKHVILTGAGKGIGRATALMLARRGARVTAMSRSADDLKELSGETGCETIALDLADADATRMATRKALPADFLINCAGIAELEPFVDMTQENFDLVYAVNLRAPMILSQEYARERIASGRKGAIVNVSSISSFFGFANHAAYCASKGGLDAMSRVMANELGKHNIRVNCINPTVTLTPMAVKAWSDPKKSAGMLSRSPLGRFAETDEVAEVILYLLSDEASMLTGLSMPVDGGFTIN